MITNGYATIAQVKEALRVYDPIDDSLIELAIEAASREIDAYCGRVFYSTTATRTYRPESSYLCLIDDLISLTSLKTSINSQWDTTWTSDKYQLEPTNGVQYGLVQPYNRIRTIDDYWFPIDLENTVQVTGVFGWTPLPADVQLACVIQSQRLFKRFDSPLGIVGMGDMGSIRVSRVDSDVQALLSPYVRVSVA
jgi:hypothetical protein